MVDATPTFKNKMNLTSNFLFPTLQSRKYFMEMYILKIISPFPLLQENWFNLQKKKSKIQMLDLPCYTLRETFSIHLDSACQLCIFFFFAFSHHIKTCLKGHIYTAWIENSSSENTAFLNISSVPEMAFELSLTHSKWLSVLFNVTKTFNHPQQ